MPKTRTSRAKGTYHYAKRADGTKYRVYHNGFKGKGSRGYYNKRTPYKTSKKSRSIPKHSSTTTRGRFSNKPYNMRTTNASVKSSHGGFCIKHKEFLGDIPSSQIFLVASLPINPGIQGTFPWLAQIAENFEEWRPKKIKFVYRSMSSNAVVAQQGNSSLGTIIMATEYNPGNPPFGNKQQMEAYQGAQSRDPSLSFKHYIQCKGTHNPLDIFYIRNGDVPGDRRFFDLGNFQIATTGMGASDVTLGELWVEYEIELLKPRLITSNALSNNPSADHFTITGDNTITNQAPFGTAVDHLKTPNPGSSLGGRLSPGIITVVNQTPDFFIPGLVLSGVSPNLSGKPTGDVAASKANTYYFPPGIQSGLYLIQYNCGFNTRGQAAGIVPVFTNCSPATILNNQVTAILDSGANANSDNIVAWTATVQITANYANITFTAPQTNNAAQPTNADFFVVQLPLGTV